MTSTDLEDRDVSAIQSADWPHRPLGALLGFRENHFQVVFAQSALDDIHLHGQAANDIEICGVLIGTGYRDEHGPYLLIEHNIRGNGARGKSTNVTFTAETWAAIQEKMDRLYPEKKMVGWYHTHPGFGIFLSDMDVFICDNFFNIPWQVAFVYDPISGEEGNFIWRNGKPQREAILTEDDVTAQSAQIPLITTDDAMSGHPDGAPHDQVPHDKVPDDKVVELLIRVRRLERRQKKLIIAMVFLSAFVIMWAVNFSSVPVFLPGAPTTQPASQLHGPAH